MTFSFAGFFACGQNNTPTETGGSGGEGGRTSQPGGANSGAQGGGANPRPASPATVSPYIVVDQFGYLVDSEKIAVLRDPETGFDASESYEPGDRYQIIDADSDSVVLELSATPWNDGQVHDQSGDRAWWVDFSELTNPGTYYLLDTESNVRSDTFRVGPDVYREVLRHALRTFFYQRAGFPKDPEFAGEAWADEASHIGPGQDQSARLYEQTDDPSTERDLSGGWYDAGDYNRYTAWTADYVVALLRAYQERPEVFGDDLNIPESGNGEPDILDEVRIGLEHLKKTQSDSGGCISVLGTDPIHESASPPSALTSPSVYGPETTNATIRAGVAFAWGAQVYLESDPEFAADLLSRAEDAWAFAQDNPELTFENTGKIAAGEQQSSSEEVALFELGLAVALYTATGEESYKAFFEDNYEEADLQLLNGYNAAWQLQFTEFYLDYTTLPDADPTIQETILSAFRETMTSNSNLGMLSENPDPYLAFIDTYTWGSNAHKSRTGCLFHDIITFDIEPQRTSEARQAAERYIHYIHGVNPLGLVYLSNMGNLGAHHSVTTFYHSWFSDSSEKWDQVGVSTYGPPPGFLTGGPNPSYDLDDVCPDQEGCPDEPPAPPYGQPPQKSYADFNDGWPVNSWSVTENSNGYQVYYIRLLSKFVH